ncbi:HIT-like protein [Xylariaceae sp. FL0804]|nr:HIT-like protein [Xylariaceae sp. FL0804]
MSDPESDPEDAITQEEITGSAPAPPAADAAGVRAGTKRNAFAELMAPRASKKPAIDDHRATTAPKEHHRSSVPTATAVAAAAFRGRDGLGAYVHDPTAFPASRVIFHDEHFVAINDLYPKAAVHTLHPFDALSSDLAFLADVRRAASRLAGHVANELQRRYGRLSAGDRAREAVLDGDYSSPSRHHDLLLLPGDADADAEDEEEEADELPSGRDWARDLRVGVHAHPSMSDLHVHVLSPDMVSDCLRHRRHYNSFATPFFVALADFPLAPDDPRRSRRRRGGEGRGESSESSSGGYLGRDLTCWRCGENFGGALMRLKDHLALEFEEWKRE